MGINRSFKFVMKRLIYSETVVHEGRQRPFEGHRFTKGLFDTPKTYMSSQFQKLKTHVVILINMVYRSKRNTGVCVRVVVFRE